MPADISIIIPTKNRLWSLPQAVESCRSRSLQVQIIVLDDASTDGTADWLAKQPDLTVLAGQGWGKPWGVNKAMALVEGKYLRFLDSDDWLNPGANEEQFALAEAGGADLVVAGLDIYREDRLQSREEWIECDDFVAQQLGETETSSHYSAFLYRTEFVRDIPHRTMFPASDFASRDDRCFILEVALREPKIAVCRKRTLCHRHHGKERLQFRGALRAMGSIIQQLFVFRRILALLEENGQLTARRKRAAAQVLWPLAHWIAATDLTEACRLLDEIRALDPEFRIPTPGLVGWCYRSLGFRATERLLNMRRLVSVCSGL